MITVDIYIPVINETYDFQLDENAGIQYIIDEIVEILAKKTGASNANRDERYPYFLCRTDKKQVLDIRKTLSECEIRNGSRLMLV